MLKPCRDKNEKARAVAGEVSFPWGIFLVIFRPGGRNSNGRRTYSTGYAHHSSNKTLRGAAAELHFGDSAARYSHPDWEREQRAEPTCYAPIQYILLGWPLALPTEVLARFPSHQHPPFSETQELAGKGRLHATDEDIVLLVRNQTPAHYSLRRVGRAACLLGDEPTRIYVPLLMRPWIMQPCHATASCHLGTARTLRMPRRACLVTYGSELRLGWEKGE